MSQVEPIISVIVPSVGRPEALLRCISAALSQSLAAAEVLVVLRPEDAASRAAMDGLGGSVSVVDAPNGGFVAALLAGASCASGEWIAFLDDDAMPSANWLEVVASHMNAGVGGVGGRIINVVNGRRSGSVGDFDWVARLQWTGRAMSHLWDEPVRRLVVDADFLPGSNMCYRRHVVECVRPGLDQGMCPSNEIEFALCARQQGLRVVYDSDAVVYHYPESRSAGAHRSDRAAYASEYARSLSYILVGRLGVFRSLAFACYFLLVGHRVAPGPVMATVLAIRGDVSGFKLLGASTRGKMRGLRAGLKSRGTAGSPKTTSRLDASTTRRLEG